MPNASGYYTESEYNLIVNDNSSIIQNTIALQLVVDSLFLDTDSLNNNILEKQSAIDVKNSEIASFPIDALLFIENYLKIVDDINLLSSELSQKSLQYDDLLLNIYNPLVASASVNSLSDASLISDIVEYTSKTSINTLERKIIDDNYLFDVSLIENDYLLAFNQKNSFINTLNRYISALSLIPISSFNLFDKNNIDYFLNNSHCEFVSSSLVNVNGRLGNFVVDSSFLCYLSPNNYTVIYKLVSSDGNHFYCPESMLSPYVAPTAIEN